MFESKLANQKVPKRRVQRRLTDSPNALAAPSGDALIRSRGMDAFTDRVDRVPKPRASYSVTVVEGPSQGARITVNPTHPSRLLVGSSEACALRISDPRVSRRHLALDLGEDGLRITDMGSTNGTFVDGVTLLDGFLRGGEIVRIGETALRVERLEQSAAPVLSDKTSFGRVIGASVEMRRLYPLCERLAAVERRCRHRGRDGHRQGGARRGSPRDRATARAGRSWSSIAPPCRPLMESELFGHERVRSRAPSRRARASSSSLTEARSSSTRSAISIRRCSRSCLRAVERGEMRRVGGDRPIHVDVRLIAATRRDLDQEVAAGRFRDDLLHRLAVARIELPPLKRRRGTWRCSLGTGGACSEAICGTTERAPPPLGARAMAGQRARATQHNRATHRARRPRADRRSSAELARSRSRRHRGGNPRGPTVRARTREGRRRVSAPIPRACAHPSGR